MAISLAPVLIALTLLFQDCLAADTCCYNADCPYLSFANSSDYYGAEISGVDDSTCCPSGGSSYVKYDGGVGALEDACRCGDSWSWTDQTCSYNASDAEACVTCDSSYNTNVVTISGNANDKCPDGGWFGQENSLCYCWFSIDTLFYSESRYVPQNCTAPAPTAGTTSCSTCTTSSGNCIPDSWICDGETDCTSGWDETGCPSTSITTPSPSSDANSDTETLTVCEFILDGVDSASFAIVGDGECDIGTSYSYSLNGIGGTTIVNDATCNYDGGDCCMATNPQLASNEYCMNPQYQSRSDAIRKMSIVAAFVVISMMSAM